VATNGKPSSKRSRRMSSIFARFMPVVLAALFSGTLVAWWMGTHLLASTLQDKLSQQLQHAVDAVSKQGFPRTEPVLNRLNQLLQASVYLYDSEGKLQSYQGMPVSPLLATLLQQQFAELPRSDGSVSTVGSIELSTEDSDYLVVMRSFNPAPASPYSGVVAFSDLSDLQRATRRGGILLAAFTFCAVALLLLVGYWLARTITGPVAELASMAEKIADGDRQVRANVERRDEIGALATSLNTMAEHLQRYEVQLLETSRLATLGELSTRLAHEIRNPLTAIKMQLQLLHSEVAEHHQVLVDGLLDEVERLELVVSSTLQLGRPGALQLQPESLNQRVEEVLRLLKPRLQHCQITLKTDLEPGLPPCLLDSARFKQILHNLLNNAAEALGDGGVIAVRTAHANSGEAMLEVEDSGPGLPAWLQLRVFEGGSSNKPNGFGLGLRVTQELVELHGGSISIGDSELGGAQFRIVFPLEG
jgi:signal transduction histidine kinase